MKGLALFESRILYSNVKSDVTVPYCTAAILHKNPYKGEKARYEGKKCENRKTEKPKNRKTEKPKNRKTEKPKN
jgi:hypothetical protein